MPGWTIKDIITDSARVLSVERGRDGITVMRFADDDTFDILVDGQDGINVPVWALQPLRRMLGMIEEGIL